MRSAEATATLDGALDGARSGAMGAERVVRELRRRGELWEAAPGVVGLRGDALALFRGVERLVRDAARAEGAPEWRTPPALALETLARADYFASFPQWLTAAAHLSDDPAALERVAAADDPAAAARTALAPAAAALPPALCYHAYAALAGTTVGARPATMTAQGTCWRHEPRAASVPALERGWAFTMRELVCVGSEEETRSFAEWGERRAVALAESLGLAAAVEPAADPFFAPTARGRALLQRVKALKRELLLPLEPRGGPRGGRRVAAASFNHHERFFGEAFDIHLADGTPAHSACCAYGVERWMLALLVAHGPDRRDWPAAVPTEDA